MSGRLQIYVLGDLKVLWDGEPLPLPPSKKTRALLAYLAVLGRPVRREHLCELLWDVPDDPRASLRWSLHKIRQVMNATNQAILSADNSRVFLKPEKIEVDFTRISARVSKDLQSLDRPSLELLAGASSGEFLGDLRLPRCPKFEAWRRYHADTALQLHQRISDALIALIDDAPESEPSPADRHFLRPVVQAHMASISGPLPLQFGAKAVASGDPRQATGGHATSADTTANGASQDVRFCETPDGVRIAYAVCGQGPPLVRAAHWMSHVHYDWQSPVWRHWIDALSQRTTLIRYDQRANGLSDWDVADVSFDAMVADLESVVDAARLDCFTLVGVSQSCPVSVAYAVRHPQRVCGLILYGGFVKGWRKRGDNHEIATHEAMTTLIREGWGSDNPVFRQLFTNMFIPTATEEQIAWFNELERVTVSPANAARLHDAFGDFDVSAMLGQISTPTLVLHARSDAAVPFHAGHEFALGIPGARFVSVDSQNHILLDNEPAFRRFCDELDRFMSTVTRARMTPSST